MKRRWIGMGVVLAMAAVLTAGGAGIAVPRAGAEQAASTTAKADEKKTVRYVGNSESKKYHKLSCDYAKKISKENRVEFSTMADAKKAGYEPCKICLPPKSSAAAKPAATGEAVAGAKGTPAKP